jgi:alkanesulfonate monooxygenase
MTTDPRRAVDVFVVNPRTQDTAQYWANIANAIKWTDAYGFTGILLFTGNDTYVEPWIAANWVFERTKNSIPLVAVNPIYMHPFTVAKMISSFAYLYKRRTYLNMVTGTSLSSMDALGDGLSHAERYTRLREFAQITASLVASPKPVTYEGSYYKVKNLQLLPKIPQALQPRYLFAGHSEDATRAASSVGGTQLQMLPSNLEKLIVSARAVHFGVITRKDEAASWTAARSAFPEDEVGRRAQELSMANTDSVWKMRMKRASEMEDAGGMPGYWLEPFRAFKADCPYFVGAYREVRLLINKLVENGTESIVLDLPPKEEEFHHVSMALGQQTLKFTARESSL